MYAFLPVSAIDILCICYKGPDAVQWLCSRIVLVYHRNCVNVGTQYKYTELLCLSPDLDFLLFFPLYNALARLALFNK